MLAIRQDETLEMAAGTRPELWYISGHVNVEGKRIVPPLDKDLQVTNDCWMKEN